MLGKRRGPGTGPPDGQQLQIITIGTRGRVLSGVLRQMQADCKTWEGTSGNGAKIGMTRWSNPAWRAVGVGPMASATICLLPIATTTSLILVALVSAFVVLWRLSLRGEAGLFPFALLSFYLLRQPRSWSNLFYATIPGTTMARRWTPVARQSRHLNPNAESAWLFNGSFRLRRGAWKLRDSGDA